MASRFWVGGTGTWDASTTTHWAATTGTAGGQTVPGSADSVTFDASSGGGTVTVNTTVNVQSITMGAFTGTLDFSANNNNVTLGFFSGAGTGVRTLNMGSGTWTITTATGNIWNMGTTTGLTFNANSSVLTFTGTAAAARNFIGGVLTYATVSVSANSGGGAWIIQNGNTFASLNVTAPNCIAFPAGGTTTITNAFTWTGTSGSLIDIGSATVGSPSTISIASGAASMTWAGVRDMTFTGGATFTATNSFNLGNDTNITITPPSAGASGPAAQRLLVQRGTPY